MTVETSVRLIEGYHDVTPVPRIAIDQHLVHRFAVVLDTRPAGMLLGDEGPWNFDMQVFLRIFDEISNTLDYTTVHLHVQAGTQLESIDALPAYLIRIPEEDRMPPLAALFYRDDALVCIEETEFWSQCGGPWPYADSDTLSFYTREDMSILFTRACVIACEREGVTVAPVIHSSASVGRVSWWKKLLFP